MATATEINRETWLAERRKGIGGSDSAAVCGVSKWRTPFQVFLDKTGDLESSETPEMRRGTLFEPVVRQMYCDATGLSVTTPGQMMQHPKYPWMLANLDGIVQGRVVIDFKTSTQRQGWGEPGTDDVPTDYLFQMQHYMLVTGFDAAELAVLFGNFELAIYPLQADAELQDMILDCEAEFWQRVIDGNPPDPETPEDVKLRWPRSVAIQVDATDDTAARCSRLRALKSQISELETEQEALASSIKAGMGEADTLVYGGKTLATWKSAAASRKFDAKAFQAAHTELYESFVVEGKSSRRFLLK